MSERSDTTAMLSDALEGLLSRRYPLWASEVRLDDGGRFPDEPHGGRVDYMAFEPKGMSHSVHSVEAGLLHVFEVKSCMDDLMSGHGLNRVGDLNWLVVTQDLWREVIETQTRTNGWRPLVYSVRKGTFRTATLRDIMQADITGRKLPISQAMWMMLTASSKAVVRGDAK